MLIWVGPSTRSNSLHHCWIQTMNPRKSALLRAVTSGEVSLKLQETARLLTQDPVDTVRLDALQLLENTDFEGKNFQVSWIGIVVVIIAWLMDVFALVLISVFIHWSFCLMVLLRRLYTSYNLSTHIVVYHIRGAVHLGLVLACCWCSSTWVIPGSCGFGKNEVLLQCLKDPAASVSLVAFETWICCSVGFCLNTFPPPGKGGKTRDPDVDQWYPIEVIDLDANMRSFDSKWLDFGKPVESQPLWGEMFFSPMVTKPAFLQHGIHQASKVS